MYPCIRSVHVVHAEPYSARVRVCAPEHELGCGQRTEDGGTDSRSSAATLATDHPPSPDTDGAISTSPRKWREVESFTRGHRACKQQTGNQADDNGRCLSPCSLPLPSGSCTLGRGLLPGSSQGPEAATPPSSALPHCMRERVGAVTSS